MDFLAAENWGRELFKIHKKHHYTLQLMVVQMKQKPTT